MKPLRGLGAGLLCGGLLVGVAVAADMPISVQGAGPYYRLTLPVAAYGLSPGSGFYDLRIHNAAGQSVPFAWVQTDTPVRTTASSTVPMFALPADSTDGATVDGFVILSNGRLQAIRQAVASKDTAKDASNNWLIDTSQIQGRLLQAHFSMAPRQTGVFALQLEASDDLKQWRRIGGQEQLLRLQHEGQSIERLTIDLGGVRAHFLRLRWLDAAHGADLSKVSIDSVLDAEPAPALQWTAELAPSQCSADYCDYLVPSGAPVHSLKVHFGQSNTLAPVRLYGMTSGSQPVASYRMHNPLYALRHQKRAPAADASTNEQLLTEAVAYRLSYPEGEVHSEAIQLSGSSWDKLRLRTNGPIAGLGATAPTLSLAIPLQTLVFLAQGSGPYAVSVADKTDAKKAAMGAPIALATLIPHYKPELLATIEQGTVAANAVAAAPQAVASTPAPAAPNRRIWLWAALLAGLAVLGGMAWSLLRGLSATPK